MVEIFQLQLHKSSAVPLYQQLAEGIEGMITDGVLLANSKLPPIRKTAEHFGVNSVTIVNAYKLLEKKQLVYSRVGSGTFVSPLPVEHIPEPVASRNLRSFESGLSMENAINFTSTSLPNEMFPVDAFKEAFNAVLDREKGGAFRYMDSMGYVPLREQLCRYLMNYGIKTSRSSPAHSRALISFQRRCCAMGMLFLWKSPRFTVQRVHFCPVGAS